MYNHTWTPPLFFKMKLKSKISKIYFTIIEKWILFGLFSSLQDIPAVRYMMLKFIYSIMVDRTLIFYVLLIVLLIYLCGLTVDLNNSWHGNECGVWLVDSIRSRQGVACHISYKRHLYLCPRLAYIYYNQRSIFNITPNTVTYRHWIPDTEARCWR